jgi:Tol biopolymer transport system component
MKKNWRILFSLALIGALCMLVPPSNIQANQKLTMEYAGKTSNIPAANGKIAFYSMRDGNFEIYKMNGDGNNLVRLTNNAALDLLPAWSPDGRKIAFQSNRDGHYEIYLMNADGTAQTRLTNDSIFTSSFPTWSPNGSQIAFYTNRDGNEEIYKMNADGSSPVRLTNSPGYDWYPDWSPDGSKIAFVSDRDGAFQVYVMNADGSGQVNLSNNAFSDNLPAWSPEGTKIAFTSTRTGNAEIFVMNADGSNPVNISNSATSDYHPCWSPDGAKIAYDTISTGIYAMNADGSSQTQLTTAMDMSPDWGRVPTNTITASAGAGGNISPNGNVEVYEGNNQSFTIAANPGYYVSGVVVDGTTVGAVTTYTFNDVIANHTITVTVTTIPTPSTVNVYNLEPSWTASGGGGVYSAYIGPPAYGYDVSPGTTAVYLGRQAGIIKAGLNMDPDGHYWDEGLFGFIPNVTINQFAASALTYDVVNQEGTNPVWMTIEIDTGVVNDRNDNTIYQFVPPANPASWHTVDARAGQWQKWNNGDGNVTGNPLISLSDIVAAYPGLNVVRTYLRLGMGDSYHGTGAGTIGWVDKVTIATVTYDFAVLTPFWDLNADHICNIGDVVIIGLKWGQTGAPGWCPEDLSPDGVINIGDVVVLGLHWGQSW